MLFSVVRVLYKRVLTIIGLTDSWRMDDFREDFLKCLHLNMKGELRALQVKKGEEWALGRGTSRYAAVPLSDRECGAGEACELQVMVAGVQRARP